MSLPPSSPRLPSPPPPAEIQIGPNSPSGGPAATQATSEIEQSHLDASSRRRIHPGTNSCDMAAGPPLVPLNELDSPFQLQEHLAALHYHHTASGTQALSRETALHLAQPPHGIDRTLWLYELCRFLISQCNSLIVGFLFDAPPCSASTCPEMRASEWQFLCAVHEQPKSCCAIDYCCHTLDWAANIVSDQRIFPSRFVVVNDAHSKNVGIKSLVNVFRRLHRIFAHAWFQHRTVFWSVEGQTGLYVFFKTVCDLYDLLPAENYKLPPEAEGLEAPSAEPEAEKAPTILKPARGLGHEEENIHASIGRTNTRRHIRSSPSTGSAVTTVMESDEEDADAVSKRLKAMHLLASHTVQEEAEVADVPVIVESGMLSGPPPYVSITPVEPTSDEATAAEAEGGQEETGPDLNPSPVLEPNAIPEKLHQDAEPADNEVIAAVEEKHVGNDDVQQDEKPDATPFTPEDHQTSEEAATTTDIIDSPVESPEEDLTAATIITPPTHDDRPQPEPETSIKKEES